jgi:D-alanyl-D-alanine carboxypeptidase
MNNTFWPNTSYLPFPYSHGYSIGSDGLILDQTYWNPSWGDAAGILISNLTDMKIYAKEINECKLLSAKMKIERFKWVDDTDAPPGIKFSGFGIEKIKNWIGHPGSVFGYNSELWYETEKKITIIIFTNTMDGHPADALLSAFAKVLSNL